MKRCYTVIAAAVLLLLSVLQGCSKSYESVPLGQQITADLAFDPRDSLGKNAKLFLLNNYLLSLNNWHNNIGGNYLDAASDDAVSSQNTLSDIQKIATGAYNAASVNADDIWTKTYAAIRANTVFIVNFPIVPLNELLPDGSPAKPAYIAEARFLRAWLYFELVKRYGGVPLMGDSVKQVTDDVLLPRQPLADCISYIVNELDKCKDSLRKQQQVTGEHYGRATQGAALALKAKVLLYAASPLFNGGNIAPGNALTGYTAYDANRWKLAADAAKAVMDLHVYSLVPSFSDVFLQQAAPVGTNTEIIFWRQNGTGHSIETNNAPVGYASAGGQGITSPTQNLVDAFPTDSGLAITAAGSGYDPANPYAHRDPRLQQTVFYNGSLWLNRAVETFAGGLDRPGGTVQQTKTGYYLRKFMGDYSASANGQYGNHFSDFMYIRYAEVLLDYAEALNEYAGPSAGVYQVLYDLRKRAGIAAGDQGTYGVQQGMSQTDMRLALQAERRIELAFEQHRFWDLRRWKMAEQVYAKPLYGLDIQQSGSGQLFYNTISVLQPVFNAPQMYLYPIPYSEIIKNNHMVQNPSW